MDLTTHLADHLAAFCASDEGRSVALKGIHPKTECLSVHGALPRPGASVLKLPLALALVEKAALGKLNLDTRHPMSAFTPTRYCSILTAFDPQTHLSVAEIMRLMLITSDNPVSVFLNSLCSFDEVNALLRQIGCTEAYMAAGFTEAELGPLNRKNRLSADDAILILAHLHSESQYKDIRTALENNLRNTRIPALLPESVTVAHKTGSLDGVVNDIGIVSDGRIAFYIAFLTDGQTDPAATATDIAQCSLSVYDVFRATRTG